MESYVAFGSYLTCLAVGFLLVIGAAYRLRDGNYDIALCEVVVAAFTITAGIITLNTRRKKQQP